jgi:hypothetical protein
MRRKGSHRHLGLQCVAAVALLAAIPAPGLAQEDHSGLTRAKYRRDCLMCHSSSTPEGVSQDILIGLQTPSRLRPREKMPTLTCWRRCEKCFPPEPVARK